MELRLFLLLIAVIMIVLIPLVPRMISFRIWVLRKLKWNGLANFHEKNFNQLVIVVRVIFALILAILVFLILRA